MVKVIKVTPYFSERLWGGQKLADFGFKLPSKNLYGEAWVISALDNGMSYIVNFNKQKISLKDFFINNEQYFGNEKQFPLLSKIICANDYLSVQVHPDDLYSLKHNNTLGKPECWYILDCPNNAKIIYGHNANTKKQLVDLVNEKEWSKLFKQVNIKKGDFLYVPPGKIHAITPGVTVFELQQSSDVTYRFYDYDRIDKNGKPRKLHLKQCFDVTSIPDTNEQILNIDHGILIDNNYFTLYLLTRTCEIDLSFLKWAQITVIEGNVTIGTVNLCASESGILVNLEKKILFNVYGKAMLSFKKINVSTY